MGFSKFRSLCVRSRDMFIERRVETGGDGEMESKTKSPYPPFSRGNKTNHHRLLPYSNSLLLEPREGVRGYDGVRDFEPYGEVGIPTRERLDAESRLCGGPESRVFHRELGAYERAHHEVLWKRK